jgi:hypothetical protein
MHLEEFRISFDSSVTAAAELPPTKILIWLNQSSRFLILLRHGLKTRRTGGVQQRRWIILIFAGWVPHEMNPSGAASVYWAGVWSVPDGERLDPRIVARIPLSQSSVSSSWLFLRGDDWFLFGNREEGRKWGLGRKLGPLVPPQPSRCQQLLLLGNRPHKAHQFPRHGSYRFLTALSMVDQFAKAPM